MISNLVQGFCRKWRNDYLDTFMRKPKWIKATQNPSLDDSVFIKRNSDLPRLGKICHLYPGPDQIVRVVDVKTSTGTHRESLRNLIPPKLDSERQPGGA